MTDYRYVDSPVGALLLVADEAGLRQLAFEDAPRPTPLDPRWRAGENAVLREACRQLEEYFDGRRRQFDLPLAPLGTPFQRRVWQALCDIGYGQTWSYARLAQRLGAPGAMRAVGAANGRNPIAVLIPCHRVIGADGRLTGYGGGLARKRLLLELEGALPRADSLAGAPSQLLSL